MKVIIREEIFGATLFYPKIGKKFYVNKKEFNDILTKNQFPLDCIFDSSPIISRIIRLTGKEKNDKFSFADIAYIELTRACNLRCKHCLNNSGKHEKNEMSYSELLRVIESLISSGIFEIRFTGGEPLLYKKIYDIIKYCSDNDLYVSIGTNGTLITENVVKKLKKCGLNKATVSLDGTKEVHDSIRGVGNYEKTINSINLLQKYGIDYKINSVIMKSNMDDIINLAKQMHKQKKPIFIRRFIESGRGANIKNNVLTFSDYEYIKKELKEELKDGKTVRGHYINLVDESQSSRIEIPFNISISCKVGQRALVITPEGNIHFCGFLAAQGFPPIGNIVYVNNFREFWENIRYVELLKELNDNLRIYNRQDKVKKTNCLAYVQNMLNNKKRLIIFYSKFNLFSNQLKKIVNDSFFTTEIFEIEKFCMTSNILNLGKNDCVYFLCCNSKDVKKCINHINGGHIINKKFLINKHDKLTCQKKLISNNINAPKIYEDLKNNIDNINYPIFCKENKHQGITFQAYNIRTLNYFFEKYDLNCFYMEESIKSVNEIKLYYINGKVISKKLNNRLPKEIITLCENVSNILKLDVFSMDLLKLKKKYYVIDVNASAGFYLSDIARKEFLYYVGELCK